MIATSRNTGRSSLIVAVLLMGELLLKHNTVIAQDPRVDETQSLPASPLSSSQPPLAADELEAARVRDEYLRPPPLSCTELVDAFIIARPVVTATEIGPMCESIYKYCLQSPGFLSFTDCKRIRNECGPQYTCLTLDLLTIPW